MNNANEHTKRIIKSVNHYKLVWNIDSGDMAISTSDYLHLRLYVLRTVYRVAGLSCPQVALSK